MKDLFSQQADHYARFRPQYPEAMIAEIISHTPGRQRAWDCATGNGQVATLLASSFEEVVATDISESQLAHAKTATNIHYQIAQAENTSFPNDHFDCITVAQAYHWFDFDRFHQEAKRVARNRAVLALFGYNFIDMHDERLNEMVRHLYEDIVGPYWDPERRHVENGYAGIPFPFQTIPHSEFSIELEWTPEMLLGYLRSWSATQKYIDDRGRDPIEEMRREVEKIWSDDRPKKVTFPIFIKMGRIEK